jgi:hypothetical protein
LLYELTTGRKPFTGETEYQVLHQIVNEDAPAPTVFVPSYPRALEKIVLRALARDPDRRFSTAVELQGAIEDFAHETRLRISALVLGRLMGTLFPSRLEDWDHAKAQGAFFVEQHVVRTLIESGKTPDPEDAVKRAVLAAAESARVATAEREARAASDDETTHVNHALTDLGGDTSVGAPPITTDVPTEITSVDSAAVPLPPPPSVPQASRQTRSGHYPGMPAAQAGTLFSSSSQSSPQLLATGVVEGPAAGAADVTERVRVPGRRQSTPTTFVRTGPSRKALYLVGGCFLAGAAIALVIVMKGGDNQVPASASGKEPPAETVVTPAPSVAQPAPADEQNEAQPTAKTPPVAEPAIAVPAVAEPAIAEPAIAEPAIAEPAIAEPKPTPAVAAKPVAKKKPSVVAKPKAKPKTEPKQEPKKWNNDSVFLPVRSDK